MRGQAENQKQKGKVSSRGFSQCDNVVVEARSGDDGQLGVKTLEIASGNIIYILSCATDDSVNL